MFATSSADMHWLTEPETCSLGIGLGATTAIGSLADIAMHYRRARPGDAPLAPLSRPGPLPLASATT
jgi:hypothetical protein